MKAHQNNFIQVCEKSYDSIKNLEEGKSSFSKLEAKAVDL